MIKWTYKKLKKEALKYKTKTEFKKGNPRAHSAATKSPDYKKICAHMPDRIDRSGANHPRFKWNLKNLKQEALKYRTRTAFQKESSGAYTAAYDANVLDLVCAHMDVLVKKWTNEMLTEEALKYKTRTEFQLLSSGYDVALKRGILGSICTHMRLGRREKWTDKELQKEALKYRTKGEFSSKSPGAYQALATRFLLDQFCSHMPKRLSGETHKGRKWTYEMLRDEALKYDTRLEFYKGSKGAYLCVYKRDLLDELCAHMGKSGGTSAPEKDLMDIVKSVYVKACKYKKSGVIILGKPHICGFELDIYISEKQKAIEFDGIYWHSLEGLKRSRLNWPEEDLINYHQIKDSYFASKGIEILHIKEKDWIKNKEKCIVKCFKFLERQ